MMKFKQRKNRAKLKRTEKNKWQGESANPWKNIETKHLFLCHYTIIHPYIFTKLVTPSQIFSSFTGSTTASHRIFKM